jgi:predicted nucleic acid-binding protein
LATSAAWSVASIQRVCSARLLMAFGLSRQARSPLPDFCIGAHAAVTGRALLTRDPRRYVSLFPRLELISPKLP